MIKKLSIEEQKNLITIAIVFGGAFLITYLTRPKSLKKTGAKDAGSLEDDKDRQQIAVPAVPDNLSSNPNAENAYMALTAYINAYNDNAPKQVLRDLNNEIASDWGLKVYRKDNSKLAVKDLNDNDVILYNI
jgi:hypothetical protein